MAMGYNKNSSFKKPFSTETVHLGTFIHTAEDMIILKLDNAGVPYPNSPVMFKSKQIGKVEEVFGQMNDPYVAVKLDSGNKAESFRLETKFEGYKDKFMQKERFLPREEVEKRKEMQDKKRDPKGRNDFKKGGFNKSSGGNRGGNRGGNDRRPQRSGDNARRGGDNERRGGDNDRRGNNDRRGGDNERRGNNDRRPQGGNRGENDRRPQGDNERSNQRSNKTKFD